MSRQRLPVIVGLAVSTARAAPPAITPSVAWFSSAAAGAAAAHAGVSGHTDGTGSARGSEQYILDHTLVRRIEERTLMSIRWLEPALSHAEQWSAGQFRHRTQEPA